MDKKMPFEVPEGYFDGFEEKMMAKFEALEQESHFEKVRNLDAGNSRDLTWRKWVTGVAAVAVILLGVFVVINLQNDVNQTGKDIVVAATTGSDDDYLDQLNEELDSEEIEEALAQIEFGNEY